MNGHVSSSIKKKTDKFSACMTFFLNTFCHTHSHLCIEVLADRPSSAFCLSLSLMFYMDTKVSSSPWIGSDFHLILTLKKLKEPPMLICDSIKHPMYFVYNMIAIQFLLNRSSESLWSI